MDNLKYAGIGSRETPGDMEMAMMLMALKLAKGGWLLRTGGAEGADTAFYTGAKTYGDIEIFLPWKKFGENIAPEYVALSAPKPEAFEIAAKYHPSWGYLKQGSKKLHARNSHIILGANLDDPVDCVVCWTKDGKETGGTAQGIRIADDMDIPILNLGDPLTNRFFCDILR